MQAPITRTYGSSVLMHVKMGNRSSLALVQTERIVIDKLRFDMLRFTNAVERRLVPHLVLQTCPPATMHRRPDPVGWEGRRSGRVLG